jgi:heterodisulfide reductase subunit B
MEYTYYPGCSLESTGVAYDKSVRAVFRALGLKLEELEDWNCCGATIYMSVKETISLSISARNLAMAEQLGRDLVAPCSACFTVLKKTKRFLAEKPDLKAKVQEALSASNLTYNGTVAVRHPIEVLINDVGLEDLSAKCTKRLDGISVASYYGCQLVRPERAFDDDIDEPVYMDRMFEHLGATAVDFPPKVRCCGGMLMTTFSEVAEKLTFEILSCAIDNGADCVVTPCPLCQANLEMYQDEISKRFGRKVKIPVLYFTQLLGLALGCSREELGFEHFISPVNGKLRALTEAKA